MQTTATSPPLTNPATPFSPSPHPPSLREQTSSQTTTTTPENAAPATSKSPSTPTYPKMTAIATSRPHRWRIISNFLSVVAMIIIVIAGIVLIVIVMVVVVRMGMVMGGKDIANGASWFL
jgi:hypothetical protein